MLQYIIFVLFIFSNGVTVHSFSLPIVSDIQEMIGLANDIQDVWAGNIPFKGLVTEVQNPQLVALEKLDKLSDQIENLAIELTDKMDDIVNELIEKIPLAQELSAAMRDFSNCIGRTDLMYEDLQDFVGEEGFNSHTINSLVKSITSRDAGDLPDVINQMHNLFVPGRSAAVRDSLLTTMIKAKAGSEDSCNPGPSFQERLYEIFNIVSLTEIRAFMLTLFAYDYLASTTNESYAKEVKKATAKFVLRMEEYILTVRNKMSTVSRMIYRCDPPKWEKRDNYVELEGLMTSYVMAEAQASSSGNCDNRCEDIDTYKTHGCYKWRTTFTGTEYEFCQRRPCLGRAYWCGSLGGDSYICEYPPESQRRYKYIKAASTYGSTEGGCEGNGLKSTFLSSKTMAFSKCDACICRCVETQGESQATRGIFFLPQMANVAENKVVSNFRFTYRNKMIYLQIEEAELLPQLRINRNTSAWVPLQDYYYHASGHYYRGGDRKELIENEEFTFITDQRRTFNLDDILLPPNHVLTGIRMSGVSRVDKKSAIQIEAHATPVDDFNTGKIGKQPGFWVLPGNQPTPHKRYTEKRTEVDYGKKYDPTKSKRNGVFSKVNEFIMFGPSNIYDDVGQTTVPLFDAQPVAVNRTTALGGIGVFVRGAKDYGGFITPRAFSVNLADYMNANMKKKQLKNFKKLYREVLAYDPPVVK